LKVVLESEYLTKVKKISDSAISYGYARWILLEKILKKLLENMQ
jgi:hypothetical protein